MKLQELAGVWKKENLFAKVVVTSKFYAFMRSNNQQINNTHDSQFWKPPLNGIFKAIFDASVQFGKGA